MAARGEIGRREACLHEIIRKTAILQYFSKLAARKLSCMMIQSNFISASSVGESMKRRRNHSDGDLLC